MGSADRCGERMAVESPGFATGVVSPARTSSSSLAVSVFTNVSRRCGSGLLVCGSADWRSGVARARLRGRLDWNLGSGNCGSCRPVRERSASIRISARAVPSSRWLSSWRTSLSWGQPRLREIGELAATSAGDERARAARAARSSDHSGESPAVTGPNGSTLSPMRTAPLACAPGGSGISASSLPGERRRQGI